MTSKESLASKTLTSSVGGAVGLFVLARLVGGGVGRRVRLVGGGVCFRVGSTVGAQVGQSVGFGVVGGSEGSLLDRGVGCDDSDGFMEGLYSGVGTKLFEGSTDEASEGAAETVGLSEGWLEGAPLDEGDVEGADDGSRLVLGDSDGVVVGPPELVGTILG